MMDEGAMLAAIAARPNDEAIRLAYADWLEEQGDERAEYIRLEEAARHPPAWTDSVWHARRRRQELQAGCTPEWLQAMGYTSGYRPLFSLPLPKQREHRWRLFTAFVETWGRPPAAASGRELVEGNLWRDLPAAMREFYSLAGNWMPGSAAHFAVQPAEDLRVHANPSGVEFCSFAFPSEERWLVLAGTRAEDPPVYATDFGNWGGRYEAAPSFSSFILALLVANTILSWPHRRTSRAPWPEAAMTSRSGLSRCYLSTESLSYREVALGEGRDILMLHSLATDELTVAARTPAAFETLPMTLRRSLA